MCGTRPVLWLLAFARHDCLFGSGSLRSLGSRCFRSSGCFFNGRCLGCGLFSCGSFGYGSLFNGRSFFLGSGLFGGLFGSLLGLFGSVFHLGFQLGQCVEVTERGRGGLVLDGGDFAGGLLLLLGSGFLGGLALGTLFVFEGAAVRKDDAAGYLIKLKNLEGQLFVELGLGFVFLYEVLRGSEAVNAVFELDDVAVLMLFDDGAFVDGTNGEYGFKYVPRILFGLLVAEAEAAVVLVDFEDYDVDVSANLGYLGPPRRKVRNA